MIRGRLQQRLFLAALVAMIPVFALHETIEIRGEMRVAGEHTAANIHAVAAAVPLLKSALIVGDLATAQEALDNVARHGQFRSLRLIDPGRAHTLAEGRLEGAAETHRVPDWFVDWLDYRFAPQEFPVMAGGTSYGILVVEPSSLFMVTVIWERIWTATLIWLLTIAIFVALLKIAFRRGLRPLDDLADAARRFGAGDLSCRAPVSDVPELAETARAFNRMADNLAEAQDKLEERISEAVRIAHYDALTGIPNRVLLADRMQQAIAQAQRTHTALAVCYLDLDGFKPVNDALGHEAGDTLLVEIARRLHATVRGGDTVARIGGDEFVLLLVGMERMDEYETTLSRVLEIVGAPILIGQRSVAVSASIGVSLYPQDAADPDLLLRHADHAMYQAKQSGRNKYHFFDPNVEAAARRHRDLSGDIENGMAGNQFELHYQPKVNMRLGTVIGFEALIRWRHPDKGLLLPQEFLPLIEEHDLIVDIGEWVIDRALAQLAVWRRRSMDMSISINIAPRHLQREDFVERLRQNLAVHADAPPGKLEIEILETAALADTGYVAEVIGKCRQLGVSFALDDFGTGYSSLSYLKNLPAQTLKIDQSLVRDMLVDANDLTIVEDVIGLADIFRRQVVAEGVETVEHGTLLLNLGCELAQGFGIAHPMPADAVDAWLGTWKPDPAWQATDGLRWPRDDLPLLIVAESNHRSWTDTVAAYVDGIATEPPELDFARCRFGRWYAAGGQHRYGHLREFSAIAEVHAQVHTLGRTLIELADQGKRPDARLRLPELFARRDELLDLLHRLMTVAATAP